MLNRAVFIDRDGTINVNVEYLDNPEGLKIYPGVPEGIRLLNEQGFKVIVVTNQSGIARGFFTEDILGQIHEKMQTELRESGANIDAIYYCPHHPDDACGCRKPEVGLFKKAERDFEIDLASSFVIGDRMLDIIAGDKLGCRTVLVPENWEKVKKELAAVDIRPDFIANDFLSGVAYILERYKR